MHSKLDYSIYHLKLLRKSHNWPFRVLTHRVVHFAGGTLLPNRCLTTSCAYFSLSRIMSGHQPLSRTKKEGRGDIQESGYPQVAVCIEGDWDSERVTVKAEIRASWF